MSHPKMGGWIVGLMGDSDAQEMLTELERQGQSPHGPPQSCLPFVNCGAVGLSAQGRTSLLLLLFMLTLLCHRKGSLGGRFWNQEIWVCCDRRGVTMPTISPKSKIQELSDTDAVVRDLCT